MLEEEEEEEEEEECILSCVVQSLIHVNDNLMAVKHRCIVILVACMSCNFRQNTCVQFITMHRNTHSSNLILGVALVT